MWFERESIFSETLKNRLLRELPEKEAKLQKFEEVTGEFDQYYMVYSSDFDGNTAERNVFYDINGNEYHN